MRDEVGKEVGENAEKNQPGNAVCGENPSAAAFVFPMERRLGLLI
jgi:hypothetical protein